MSGQLAARFDGLMLVPDFDRVVPRPERDATDLGLSWVPPEGPSAPRSTAHECAGGWIESDGGAVRPCLTCKPHLRPVELGRGRTGWRVER